MSESQTRFIVSQVGWVELGTLYFRRVPRDVSVAEFATFDEAEADRRVREDEFRRQANPFRYGGAALFYQSSLDAPRLHDWLLDVGIDPPINPTKHIDWIKWWDAFVHTWSDEQRLHAWQALDKVQLFEVTERKLTRKAYVIVELNWTWHDEPSLEADYEGGNVVRAFRSRENAQAECDRMNRERQGQRDHQGYNSFNIGTRAGRDSPWEGRAISDTVFFEVVEIELEENA